MSVTVVQLRELLASDERSNTRVRRSLKSFRCERNEDVTSFLGRYAINNERNGASRSFLACDDGRLAENTLEVVAFYTKGPGCPRHKDGDERRLSSDAPCPPRRQPSVSSACGFHHPENSVTHINMIW